MVTFNRIFDAYDILSQIQKLTGTLSVTALIAVEFSIFVSVLQYPHVKTARSSLFTNISLMVPFRGILSPSEEVTRNPQKIVTAENMLVPVVNRDRG